MGQQKVKQWEKTERRWKGQRSVDLCHPKANLCLLYTYNEIYLGLYMDRCVNGLEFSCSHMKKALRSRAESNCSRGGHLFPDLARSRQSRI